MLWVLIRSVLVSTSNEYQQLIEKFYTFWTQKKKKKKKISLFYKWGASDE